MSVFPRSRRQVIQVGLGWALGMVLADHAVGQPHHEAHIVLDKQDADYDAVQLSTLHAAKGLEYGHVFLVGVEEGILPHRESTEPGKVEEERRLMYVGITRAQRSLHLSYCERRKQARDFIPSEPSRFIAEMGKEDLRFSGGKAAAEPDKATGNARLAAMKAMLAGKTP